MTVRDLGAGVHEHPDDPWADMGRRDALDHPETNGKPLCPICGTNTDVDHNTSAAGGLICWHCGTVFTTRPGEWAANTATRQLYAREYRKGG